MTKKAPRSVVARIWNNIRAKFPKIGTSKEISKVIRFGTPEEIESMVSEPEVDIPTPKPQPIDAIFQIENPVDFYSELWRSVSDRAESDGDSWANLSAGERALLAAWSMQCEVNNGGWEQYFFNSSGDHASELVSGLTLLGAPKMAEIARRALAVFPDGKPSPDREKRWSQVDRIEKQSKPIWYALSDEFYECGEKLHLLVFAYANAHRAEFGA